MDESYRGSPLGALFHAVISFHKRKEKEKSIKFEANHLFPAIWSMLIPAKELVHVGSCSSMYHEDEY